MRRPVQHNLNRLVQRNAARETSRIANSTLSVESRRPLWMRSTAWVMAVVTYLSPVAFLADEVAHAAPIVDPRAPIAFQPTITQTSAGVAAVNIASPNANGISVNSFQALSVDGSGLVLNNSLSSGTPLLGGTLGANPNLAGRTASTILAQVTSTGTQYRSVLAGPLEIFGSPAALIVSNPNGISVNGLSVTNASNLTLTTGAAQFLTGVGGTSTDFAHAAAVAYSVTSGDISISGPAGVNGTPGAGIEGTVGNLDLIGQSVSIAAPLYADQRVNVIAGNQTVTPVSADATGTSYATAANGGPAAPTSSGYAIDASQYGSVTAGQIFIVSNAAGVGARALGPLAATAGNLVVTSNGDIVAGSTYAQQGATLTSAGNVSMSGNGLANQYTVTAAGDISAAGATVQSVQDLNMTAGGSLSVGTAQSNGNVNLTSGGDMSVGSIATGNNLTLTTTGKTGNGDLTVGGAVSAPGALALNAARDVTVNGAVTGGSAVQIAAQRNASVNGQAKSGGTLSLTGTTGNVSTAGNVLANGDLTATAGQAMALGGNVSTSGNTTLTAGTDLTVSGNVSGNGTGSLGAGGNLSGAGSASFGQDATLSAGQAIDLTGALQTGGNLNATAGSGLTVGAATAVGNATLKANGGDASINGAVLSGGNLVAQATGNLTVAGSTTSLGTTTLTAQSGNLSAQGNLQSAGDASLSAGQNLAVTGTTQVGGNATLSGANITTGGTTTVSGTLNATAQNTLDLSAGQLNVVKDATLSGTNVSTGGALIGGNLTANASNQLTTGGSNTLVQGAAKLTGTNGVTNTSSLLAGGPLTVTGANVTNGSGASLISTAATTINATDVNNAGSIAGLTTAVTANGSLTNNNGAIIGTNSLNVTTGNLAGNQNGVLFAGSTDAANPGTPGDATVTVTGGNGTFNNAGGQILAQHDLTLNLQNQAYDPSAASSGTINLGNALTINTQQLNNSGTWAMPGNSVSINATQGFSNSGTISKAGDITLSTSGTLTNSGTISAGNDVNLSGTIVNQAGGTIHANEDVNLTGATTNAGTVSAVRDVNLNGSSYDNTGASTAAGRNLTANLSGDMTNVGGTLTAQNDITINAANVNNSRAGANTTTTSTSTTTIDAAGLDSAFLSAPMGSLTLSMTELSYADGSVTGSQTFTANITGRVGDMQPASATSVTAADLSGGTFYGIALPTVNQTTTTTQPSGQSGVIAAGHDLSITTGTLNNHGSTISAGNNVTLNVASLDNGGDAAVTTITDSIDAASYASFLTQLKAAYTAGTLAAMLDTVDAVGNPTGAMVVPANVITTTAPPAGQTSTVTVYTSQNAGQIVAGNNLALTGTGASLTNAGSLYAGQDLRVTANSFTNQGYHTDTVTSKTGCVAGVAAADCGYFSTMVSYPNEQVMFERPGQDFTDAMTNAAIAQELLHFYATFGPNNDSANIYGDQTSTQTYSYTQTNNTVFAGRDLIIAAPTVNNTYGNLLAGRDVVIGGAGTTRDNTDPNNPQTNLTQASTVTNTSGNIQAGRDIAISAAALTNTLSAPFQVYQNYGTTARFGCSGATGHFCDAFVDQQSGDASTITANRNLSINAGSVVNTGSLITAGSQATITAAAGVTNQDQTLNAYWHDTSPPIIGNAPAPDNFGCGTAANCATLFGSAYSARDGVQPPTPYASLPGTIQAPSLTVTAGGQLQNSGNVMGQQVALTGATIVNGLTSPAVYTPQATGSQQVISLGPVGTPVAATNAANQAAGLGQVGTGLAGASGIAGSISNGSSGALGSAASAGSGGGSVSVPGSPSVQTVAGVTHSATYLVSSPASQVMGDIGAAQLLASLPASLQPNTTQFYYDPFTEDQVLQQAALAQTGQASFISGLSFDNKNQTSVANQEKQVLYGNAIQYAEANNIALGTALSQAQIAALDAPMLWYVEETVPQPGCTATGSASCPTVTALMPQVYLPQNYAVVQHDGTITGQDVSLTATSGGSILNTGSITATDTLTVNGGTLTNQQRSTDIGTQYSFINSVAGLLTTTGTEVQQGGFMSAGNYQMNVDAVNQIGGALQKLNADGTVDAAGTAQELANLKAQLGSSFTQGTVSNDLNTTFTSLADSGGAFQQIGMLAVMVVASVMTAGAASAAIGAGATVGSTFAAGTVATTTAEGVAIDAVSAGLGNMALSAGMAGMVSSALGQAAAGSFSTAAMLQAGGIAMVTAGLTNGITVGGQSLASLAGVQNVGGALVPQAGAATAGTVLEEGAALAAEATVQAGVQTAIGGGSFFTNLKNDAVSDVAAAGAYAIGNAASVDGSAIQVGTPGYWLAHAALGCAAGAASGTGCASSAIGGAASAIVSPYLVDQAGGAANLTLGDQAAITAIAMIAGGGAAGLLGQNAAAAAIASENEAMNNSEAVHSGGVKPLGGLVSQVCGPPNPPCSDAMIQTLVNAQAQNSTMALANMQTAAPYVAGTLGVALLGPEALTAAALAGGFDYEGDAVSYATGLSKDAPSFTKSYITGVVSGLTYPFAIADEAITGMGTAGKIAANGYNAVVAGTGAFGSAAITHQTSPDASGGFSAGSAAFGGAAKAMLPGSVGNFLNNLIQGLSGPFQNAVMPGG